MNPKRARKPSKVGQRIYKAAQAPPLPDCEHVEVTARRLRALLIDDALRWERGDVLERGNAINEKHEETDHFTYNHWRGTPGTYAGGYATVVPCGRLWHPPQLDSDHPGRTAYGTSE